MLFKTDTNKKQHVILNQTSSQDFITITWIWTHILNYK